MALKHDRLRDERSRKEQQIDNANGGLVLVDREALGGADGGFGQ
jgi:hypothetical protein